MRETSDDRRGFHALRGMKTLPYHRDARCQNAPRVADVLDTHNSDERVFFSGLIEQLAWTTPPVYRPAERETAHIYDELDDAEDIIADPDQALLAIVA